MKNTGSKSKVTVDDIKRQFRYLVNDFEELYPQKRFKNIMSSYKILDTQDKETNLLLTISDSCLSNLITKGPKNEY